MSKKQKQSDPRSSLRRYRLLAQKSSALGEAWACAPPPFRWIVGAITIVGIVGFVELSQHIGIHVAPSWVVRLLGV